VRVVAKILSPSYKLPILPDTAAEILSLAQERDMSFQNVERAVREDLMVTTRILAVANSPMYSRGGVVTSLRTALLRLGSGSLRDVLCQAVAEAHVFRGGSARFLRRQRLHGIAVGHLTRVIDRETRSGLGEPFLCGLLHDLGRPLAHAELEAVIPDATARDAALDRIHARLGQRVAAAWNLPSEVQDAIGRHHDHGTPGARDYSRIGNVVAAAERLAYHHGLGDHQATVLADDPVFAGLGLDAGQVEALLADCADLATRIG
jgi:HD-like signal output (HDOD) protein